MKVLDVYFTDPSQKKLVDFFYGEGFTISKKWYDSDLIIFNGEGTHVSPFLYGEKSISDTVVNMNQDREEIRLFRFCNGRNKPMLGINRGAEMLNVLSGGSLWQYTNKHDKPHFLFAEGEDSPFLVASSHTQLMVPRMSDCVILAKAHESTNRRMEGYEESNEDLHINRSEDPEIVWYDNSRSLCVQYDPSKYETTAYSKGVQYFWDLLDTLILDDLRKPTKEQRKECD